MPRQTSQPHRPGQPQPVLPARAMQLGGRGGPTLLEETAYGLDMIIADLPGDVLRLDVGGVPCAVHLLHAEGLLHALALQPQDVGLEVSQLPQALPLRDAQCSTGVDVNHQGGLLAEVLKKGEDSKSF